MTDVLQFSISESVRLQDSVVSISSVASNPTAREEVWKLFTSNKAKFIAMQRQSGILFSRVAKAMLHNFSSHQRADEISKFFRENAFDGSEVRAVDQAVEVNLYFF